MSWGDVASVVENLAPTIASVIGGPLAGSGVSALEKLFGLTPAPSLNLTERTNDVAAAIAGATPQQLADMRKADQDYAVAMAQAGFKDTETLASLKVQDTVSARDMQTANKSPVPAWLTFVITCGFFGLLIGLFCAPVPEASKALIYSATGTLGTVWLVVVHFWFGSTSDTSQVNDLLAKSTPADGQK
ncbi:hypothetical protein FSO04_41940 [Paraburkholderia madseniana]|uniref:Uncharacterized protein n=1 Tax=Paraburkholderia madseniana TaxID=2599607 RepID=A0A6N6W0M6_9BURK|nr:hypothetical protein [Paraburkholderia madseniana]KAE8754013.1 hypothetical protein FSO04_41940 [Paraburkholderia madseniana]